MTANVNVTKLLFKRGNTVQNANYTGINGEITVDTQAKTLRIHDGVTAGGNVITAGGVVGAYSNTNAAAYIPTDPTITSIQANVAAANAAISAITGIDTSLIANAATQQTQINLVNANVTAANAAITSLQSNAASQATSINSINANIGAYQIFANTNAASQATSINSINANLGAFQTYANTTFGTSNYGNTNVAAYLGAFNGNILPAANVTYSLGNSTYQWRDLWVSNNTIYIGNVPIRVDGGRLLVNNTAVTDTVSKLTNSTSVFQLFANGESRSPDTIFASNGVSIINANGAIQGGIYNSGDADFFNIGASTGRGIKFYVNEETEGPLFFANGSVNVPVNLYSDAGDIGDIGLYGGTISGTNPGWEYLSLINQGEGSVFVQLPSEATASVANLRIHNDIGNVEIATGDGFSYNYWYFKNDGDLTIPRNIFGSGANPLVIQNTSSGPAYLELPIAPSTNAVYLANQDPTGNVVIRTGDFGSENDWAFGMDGNLTIPGNINYANGVSILSGLGGAVTGNISVDTSAIQFVASSSGDGNGYSTIRMIPDTNLEGNEQYIILDPTAPGHIHIRAGGPQDNSYSSLFLGGEYTYFQVASGANSAARIGANSYVWTFGTDGTFTLPGNEIVNQNSQLNSVGNSSGDGNGYTTLHLIPDTSVTGTDQYLIIDPTAPGHIHIRAGGTQDDSGADLILGGENSHVKVTGGLDPPVYVTANNNNWMFGTDGVLQTPGGVTLQGNIQFSDLTVQTTAWTGSVTFGNTIAIGYSTGTVSQGAEAVAVGRLAGNVNQSGAAVAVGRAAGRDNQGTEAVSIGADTGQQNQGAYAVAIGSVTAYLNQGTGAVAIGTSAGSVNQGTHAIAIGTGAGAGNQGNSSIILNATGSTLNQTTDNTFTVKPIRNASGGTVLYYNASTGEITYDTAGAGSYGNANVATYLPTYTGNIAANIAKNGYSWNFGTDSKLTIPGTIQHTTTTSQVLLTENTFRFEANAAFGGTYIEGQQTGLFLLGGDGGTTIGANGPTWYFSANGNVELATSGSNPDRGIVFGDATFQPTAFSAANIASLNTLSSRVNQAVNLTSSPQFAGLTTTANVNMTANVRIHQNLVVDGNINFIGNVTQTNITTANAVFTGDTYGFGALYAGVIGYTPLPYTVIQATADYNDYSQINFQNLNLSANASTEWVATAGNGTDLTNYIDFGIAGGAWDGTQLNSVGTAAKANDGWLYVLGNTAAGTGGNLVLGTTQPGKRVNILTGGPGSANIYSYFTSDGLITSNVYATRYLYANGVSILTGISGTYSNTNVASYLAGNVTIGNINFGGGQLRINGTTQTIDTGNGSAIIIGSRINLTGSAAGLSMSVTHPAQFSSSLTVGTNSNATSFYGTNYFYTNGVSILSGIGGTYSNANVAAYLTSYTGNIAANNITVSNTISAVSITTSGTSGNITGANVISANTFVFAANGVNILSAASGSATDDVLRANVGAYQIFANANAATQATSINTINANLGAFQTYANATFGTSSYGNTQVAAYLLTYPNANIATLNTTSGNIVTLRAANFNSANAVITGGYVNSLSNLTATTTQTTNLSTGNAVISGGYISALTNASVITATITTVNSTSGNITTLATTNLSTANAVITGGYASGLANITVTGNATVGNLIGSSPNTTIIAGAYSSTFNSVGNVILPNLFVSGNSTTMGIAPGYAPNRPAFRVYGSGVNTTQTTSNVNLKNEVLTVDYNQGNYYNNTTGVFTAPVVGLYSTTLVARVANNNGLNQIAILRNGNNIGANVVAFWETDTNTGVATHFGTSGTIRLNAGEFLSANILAGNISFDGNDSWTVTYLG